MHQNTLLQAQHLDHLAQTWNSLFLLNNVFHANVKLVVLVNERERVYSTITSYRVVYRSVHFWKACFESR